MDLYELLEILIEGHAWNYEGRKADALQLVRELKEGNAFGTFVAGTQANAHEHRWEQQYGDGKKWMTCRLCKAETVRVPHLRKW